MFFFIILAPEGSLKIRINGGEDSCFAMFNVRKVEVDTHETYLGL